MTLTIGANMANVIVLGNGFDIALGLPTKYADFANSRKWPFPTRNFRHEVCLQNYFLDYIQDNSDEMDRVRWIDIEGLLLSYALDRKEKKDSNEILANVDKEAYKRLCSAFSEYLKENVVPHINKECKRNRYLYDLLTAIKENGSYTDGYTFNYTPTRDILDKYFGLNINVTHLHGILSDTSNPPILGISDNYEIESYYKFLRKSWFDSYKFHDMNDALYMADECVFYGISFGKADFIYFENFFKDAIRNHQHGTKKKMINIFTFDETSRLQILESFESVGISMSQLNSALEIRIHKTSEFDTQHPNSFDKCKEFLYHLSPNSENGIVGIENMLRKGFNS